MKDKIQLKKGNKNKNIKQFCCVTNNKAERLTKYSEVKTGYGKEEIKV